MLKDLLVVVMDRKIMVHLISFIVSDKWRAEMMLEQVQQLNWTEGSTRALVLIGDNIPHTPEEAEQQMKNYNIPNPRQVSIKSITWQIDWQLHDRLTGE